MKTEFRVYLHLCAEDDGGGCFSDTQTLGTRPDPETLKALLDEAACTFSLLFDAEPHHRTVELSKTDAEEQGTLDPDAAEKK